MKNLLFLVFSIFLAITFTTLQGQEQEAQTGKKLFEDDSSIWAIYNREVRFGKEIYLNGKPGSGFVYIKNSNFGSGTIELEIKGKNEKGKSFVGIAFHGQNDSTYEAIYFRPFNFITPEKIGNSVQYIYNPEYTRYHLRKKFTKTFF